MKLFSYMVYGGGGPHKGMFIVIPGCSYCPLVLKLYTIYITDGSPMEDYSV